MVYIDAGLATTYLLGVAVLILPVAILVLVFI